MNRFDNTETAMYIVKNSNQEEGVFINFFDYLTFINYFVTALVTYDCS